MNSGRRHDLVLSIYPQTRGFAFTAFEGILAPVDWGVHDPRGPDKNTRCLKQIGALFTSHAPEILVLQDMSVSGTRRAPRIRELNHHIVELAEAHGLPVRSYSRVQVLEFFSQRGATTKQTIAEMIAKHVPALGLYVPPARKRWMNEHVHMGIFDAAALAWVFFHASGDSNPSAA
jgi:hypothetical protein